MPITHADMTRFVITLDRGVEFVLHGILEMFGGEIFVPKLPSMKILDIVDFIAPGAEIKVIGIRPGEKLHEIMIPLEESRNVVDLGDHYIIQPAFNWWNTNALKEKLSKSDGKGPITDPFEYASNTNDWWLSTDELRECIAAVKID